jgi:hypothetical protein
VNFVGIFLEQMCDTENLKKIADPIFSDFLYSFYYIWLNYVKSSLERPSLIMNSKSVHQDAFIV